MFLKVNQWFFILFSDQFKDSICDYFEPRGMFFYPSYYFRNFIISQ